MVGSTNGSQNGSRILRHFDVEETLEEEAQAAAATTASPPAATAAAATRGK